MRTRHTAALRRRVGVLALAGALALSACDAADDDVTTPDEELDDTSQDPDVDDAEVADPPPELPDHDVPDTPAGEQLAWMLDAIQPGADLPTPGQIADRIGPPLEGMVQPGQLLNALQGLGEDGPWELDDVSDGETQTTATLRNPDDDEIVINLTVDDEGRMIGLILAGEDEVDPDELEQGDDAGDNDGGDDDAEDSGDDAEDPAQG
jgi:hypothetical protein